MNAADIIIALSIRGHTVATAESLTGGLLCGILTSVPGASAVVRGGVVAYAVDIKANVLNVDAELLARHGAVDPVVAVHMAVGVRHLFGATYGVATTGSAGPDPDPGGTLTGPVPPGRGFAAVAGPDGDVVIGFDNPDRDREGGRQGAIEATLTALRRSLDGVHGTDDRRASG